MLGCIQKQDQLECGTRAQFVVTDDVTVVVPSDVAPHGLHRFSGCLYRNSLKQRRNNVRRRWQEVSVEEQGLVAPLR